MVSCSDSKLVGDFVPMKPFCSAAAVVISVSFLLLAANGCGGGTASAAAPAPTISITASPSTVASGGSSTLAVTATNATSVVISDNADNSTYSLATTGGTQAVTPTKTTIYTATATGAGGSTVASATVTVAAGPTVTITASPTTISVGGSSTLTVTATNATSVVISDNVDSTTYTLATAGGTQVVTPTKTATYTATAIGAGGKAATTTTVTVASGPTVTLTASPTTVATGASSTLIVTATGASSVVISDNVDSTTYTLAGTGGAQVVTPSKTTIYTATATGPGGTASSTATVTVSNAAPTVAITASPTSVTSGGNSTLTVTATGASGVVISDNVDSTTYTLAGAGGTQVVTPTKTTVYMATATGPGGTNSASVAVTVAAPTVTIAANPASVVSGGSSTLSVTATGATGVVISDNVDSTTYTLAATGGTQVMTPMQTTTYTATATGAGGTVTAATTVTFTVGAPTVTITANPTSVASGGSSTLTVTAAGASSVVVSDNVDSTTYTLAATGGTQAVTVTQNTTYTATATGAGGTTTATTRVNIAGSVSAVNHVLFMMQENRTFDTYFGMLNPYRVANGWNKGDDGNIYNVDGIEDKLSTTNPTDLNNSLVPEEAIPLFHTSSSCLDDMSSSWLESYGDVNRYDASYNRSIFMNGFVHTAEGFAQNGANIPNNSNGSFTDLAGQRAMAYYQDTSPSGQPQLNYYYYMASQFALSDRWFSPVASKSTPNRIATLTGGTTQGLVFDPYADDHEPTALSARTIFQQLDEATPQVSWKIYYTMTAGGCDDSDGDCGTEDYSSYLPTSTFLDFGYSGKYLYSNPSQAACVWPTTGSKAAVNDPDNSFCIDTNHIAPLSQLYLDMNNPQNLPQFAYIEAGYGVNDEHPGSGQSIFEGQARMALILNTFMSSQAWADSVFFLSYDEGGGPYDHVPPVPGYSNQNTIIDKMGYLPGGTLPSGPFAAGTIPDISTIAVNPDSYNPCLPPTVGTPTAHCDLNAADPGANTKDAAAKYGFAAQLGFRLPNLVISPFTRKHYVSHIPMDHTAVIRFVENRFIGPSSHLTNRDLAQPDLTDFFDFTNVPWQTAPTGMPTPSAESTCTPTSMGP